MTARWDDQPNELRSVQDLHDEGWVDIGYTDEPPQMRRDINFGIRIPADVQPRVRLWDADMHEIPGTPTHEHTRAHSRIDPCTLVAVEINGMVYTFDVHEHGNADPITRAQRAIGTILDGLLSCTEDMYEDTVLAMQRFTRQQQQQRTRPKCCDPQPVIDKIDQLVNESLEQGWFDAK